MCQRAAYPCCLALGRGRWVRADMKAGLSQTDKKAQKPAKAPDPEYTNLSPADSLNLSLCPILTKILRQGEWLRLKGGRGGARLPWVASRVWQSGKWGGGGQAPTGGKARLVGAGGWQLAMALGNVQQMVLRN